MTTKETECMGFDKHYGCARDGTRDCKKCGYKSNEKIKCKGWTTVLGKHYDCSAKRTINENNSYEESRDLDMCKYCFNKECDSNEAGGG